MSPIEPDHLHFGPYPPLITLEAAKQQLRIAPNNNTHDADIQAKILEASAILMDWIKQPAVPDSWMSGSPAVMTVPPLVQSVTKLILSELFENREASVANVISPAVQTLLQRLFDPALA